VAVGSRFASSTIRALPGAARPRLFLSLSSVGILNPDIIIRPQPPDHPEVVSALNALAGEANTAGEPFGEGERTYVDPALRGRRIGSRLLSVLEGVLRGQGVTLALLETGADQSNALRLYMRCDYTPRGPFGGYADNGKSLFFEKRL
jgi:GNAT superfamily N-acetyltransferase